MFQNRRLVPPTLLSLTLLSFGTFGIIAAALSPLNAAPLNATPASPGATATPSRKLPISGDGSLFGEVIPAELEQQVTVKPAWLPLSKHLAALQDATKVPLSLNPSVPDDWIFIAASARTEFSVLRQVRLLLTDDTWRSQWVSSDLGPEKPAYHLGREAVTPKERRAKMAQAAKDRLAKVLALLAAGPAAWDAARQGDPELSSGLPQPIRQAPLLLASELSPEQLDSVLMGQPLTLSVANMPAQDQALVRQSLTAVVTDPPPMTTATSTITGEKRIVFDARHLLTTGEVVFESAPATDNPGSLELAMHVFTEPTHEFGMGSNGMLMLSPSDFNPDEKQRIEEQHRLEAADALAAKIPGAKTVTIDKAAQPQPGEPTLAAYLRAFAEQTQLTVLAHWPQGSKALTDDKGLPKRLPASIVNKPAGEALDILCKTYGGEWVQDEATVYLRALPTSEMGAKKLAVPILAPPASPRP